MAKKKYDFGGFATKYNVKCVDGLTIAQDAFADADGLKIPLVYQHVHDDPENVLGHAILESRSDGVYAYCSFNNSRKAKHAKEAVLHGDLDALSIFANGVKKRGSSVIHGVLREVSLVLAGANGKAKIDAMEFAHGDGFSYVDENEILIYTGLPLTMNVEQDDGSVTHSALPEEKNPVLEASSPAAGDSLALYNSIKHQALTTDKTVQEVFDTLNTDQKDLVYALIGNAIEDADSTAHSGIKGEEDMGRNLFENMDNEKGYNASILTHSMLNDMLKEAQKTKRSLKDIYLEHAASHGFDPIDVLFPEARNVRPEPDTVKRDDGWVSEWLGGTSKTPFARIRSVSADLTDDEARARGYITGDRKKEEVIPLLKRVTTPTTIYKKQKLDRDDLVDITDFDVVVWLRREMRAMLNEELARACLVGDGRDVSSRDKINEQNIRPVYKDDDLYNTKILLENNISIVDMIDEIAMARRQYKGSSNPAFWTTTDTVSRMLLARDAVNRKLYPTLADLASALRVARIVEVEVMENVSRPVILSDTTVVNAELIGIMVNPRDYTIGADKGGEVNMFDDFDIDYNQYTYLMETRVSGALTRPKSAVTIERKQAAAG